MSEDKVQEVVFFCGRYPNLVLDVRGYGHGLRDKYGNKLPAKHHRFGLDKELGAGILRCSNQEDIDFLRNHEYFYAKKIVEVKAGEIIPMKENSLKVQSGAHTTRDTRKAAGEPASGVRAVRAARVPAQ